VICVDVTLVAYQIVYTYLQGVHNSCKFKVMGRVALLMVLQLSRAICYDPPILHQDTTKSLSESIAIDHEVLPNLKQC
jgi:hypothetical protein